MLLGLMENLKAQNVSIEEEKEMPAGFAGTSTSTVSPHSFTAGRNGLEEIGVAVVLTLVVVTLIITCILRHSRMGLRLWSDIRNTLIGSYLLQSSSSPFFFSLQSSSSSSNQTYISHNPLSHSHSVLYVCERVHSNTGGLMASSSQNRCSGRHSSRKVTAKTPPVKGGNKDSSTLGFPIQISLPDGETAHHFYNPSPRHNCGIDQQAEMVRGYIKPPENKSLFDVEMEMSDKLHSHSLNVLGTRRTGDACNSSKCFNAVSSSSSSLSLHGLIRPSSDTPPIYYYCSSGSGSSSYQRHRYSTPLDGREQQPNSCHSSQHLRNTAGYPDFTSCSSSSLCSTVSSDSIGSRLVSRSRSKSRQAYFIPTVSLAKEKEFSRKPLESSKRLSDCDEQSLFGTSSSKALADITVVPCEAAAAADYSNQSLPDNVASTSSRLCGCPSSLCSDVLGNTSLAENQFKDKKRTRSLSNFHFNSFKNQND